MLARNKIVLLYQAKGAAQVRNIVLFLTLKSERLGQRIKCRRISYSGGRKAWPKNNMSSYFLLWRAKGAARGTGTLRWGLRHTRLLQQLPEHKYRTVNDYKK
jgi:hypothetical protein